MKPVHAKIIGPTFITLMVNGNTTTINNDHVNYSRIRDALRVDDYDLAESLINTKVAVERFAANGKITVVGGTVYYNGEELLNSVVDRILTMIRDGFDAQPMINFLENLMQNPSKRAVDELYGFLESSNLPITEDGYFLAYKKVNESYYDFYTGKVLNKPAYLMTEQEKSKLPVTRNGNVTTRIVSDVTELEMPRNSVDDNKDRTCSQGLHFCSLSYLPHYHGNSGRVLIVKINPADVVSIPSDYNNAKGRAYKYQIVGENTKTTREKDHYFTSTVYKTTTDSVKPVSGYKSTVASVKIERPGLTGYNAGRSDRANSRAYYIPNAASFHNVDDENAYISAYKKGYYDSVISKSSSSTVVNKPATPTASTSPVAQSKDYQIGYNAGKVVAESHIKMNYKYDDNASKYNTSLNANYEKGYKDAYKLFRTSSAPVANTTVAESYYNIGYKAGYRDSSIRVAYNESISFSNVLNVSATDKKQYQMGYVNGWRDNKLNLPSAV